MKIYIHDSQTLRAITAELVQEYDPDYIDPNHIPPRVSERLRHLVMYALTTPQQNEHRHVELLRRDPVIMHILRLPWADIKITHHAGTILIQVQESL